MNVEWDFTKPTEPVELGSRSGDVVSVRGGGGAMLTVRFPNGCVVTTSFDSADALRFLDMRGPGAEFVDFVSVSHTAFDGDENIGTIGREQVAVVEGSFVFDDEVRADLDRYLDDWDRVLADPSQRPFPSVGIIPMSFSTAGTDDDWRAVLRFERGPDFLFVNLDISFDPLAESGSDAQNCDETTG
jgi:hypothetical protein